MTALGLRVPQNRSEWTQIGEGGSLAEARVRESQSCTVESNVSSDVRLQNKVQPQNGTVAVKFGALSFNVFFRSSKNNDANMEFFMY